MHESRRGTKTTSKKQEEKAIALISKRKAPYTQQGQGKEGASIRKARKRKAEDQIIRHVAFVASTAAPSEQILERLRARVNRRQTEHEVMIKARRGDIVQCQKTEVEVKIKDDAETDGVQARAHSIAESIRTSSGAIRERFRDKLHARIQEQKEHRKSKIATCMQNQRTHERKADTKELQGTIDSGQSVAPVGVKRGEISEGISTSNNPNKDDALGGRHQVKGKGVGRASLRHKGGHEDGAICRLLAIKPKR